MFAGFRPLRLQLLTSTGNLLYDHTWKWPVAGAAAEGVAALIQASRQFGGEVDAGELSRLVFEAPSDQSSAPPSSLGVDSHHHGAAVEAVIIPGGGASHLLCVVYQEIVSSAGGDGDASEVGARRYAELVLLAFQNAFSSVLQRLDNKGGSSGSGGGGGSRAGVARAEISEGIEAFDKTVNDLLATITGAGAGAGTAAAADSVTEQEQHGTAIGTSALPPSSEAPSFARTAQVLTRYS